ncbi:hypothetical protein TNCV_1299591 [Trichonephila clavipes]|nr:hypothetical protein TNCV_1299591 [Trichonephila clavipes]
MIFLISSFSGVSVKILPLPGFRPPLLDLLRELCLLGIILGKILGGPTAVFGAKKRQIEGFQKGVNDEKLLGSACVGEGREGGMKWAFRKDEIE